MNINVILSLLIAIVWLSNCKPKVVSEQNDLSDIYHYSVGEGPPIVVIHGGPGLGSSYMSEHLDPLKDKHQLIFYDQVNSGQSPLITDSTKISLPAFIADIDNIRKYYNHDRISIIAHSWGGLLGMKYAAKYPNHTDKLILINSLTANSAINDDANTRLVNQMSADDHEARSRIMRTAAFKNQNPKAYEELMQIGFGYQFSDRNLITQLKLNLPDDFGTKSQYLGYLFKDLSKYDFTHELLKIETPTYLLYGLDDPLTSLALNNLGQSFKDVKITAIDDAGHFPFIEKQDETIQAILAFME